LIDTVVESHVLIGHNLIGFDLFWLAQETDKRPTYALDTLILTRQCEPELLTYLNYDAASGDTGRAEEAIEMLNGKDEARASLEYVAASLGLPSLDKTYQHLANWCLSALSPEHYSYVLHDIHVPMAILKHIFGTTNVENILQTLRTDYPWYEYARAAYALTGTKGVPYSEAEATKLTAELSDELIQAVESLKEWPEFEHDVLKTLVDCPCDTYSELEASV
jgi:hypothetical protein